MHLSSSEFKSLVTKSGNESLSKQYVSAPSDAGQRRIKFVISTNAVDRDNDTINQSGWQLENFIKNPVVLWGHDSGNLPIGKAVQIGVEDGNLTATVEFVPADVPIAGPMAEAVHQLLSMNYLGAVSVGFRPTEWEFPDDRSNGCDFKKQELLEFSVVSIPSNPQALVADLPDVYDEPDQDIQQADQEDPDGSEVLLNTSRITLKTRLDMRLRLLGIKK